MRKSLRLNMSKTLGEAAVAIGIATSAAAIAISPAHAGGMYEIHSTDYTVGIDQARVLQVEGAARVIAVGNPSIADALIQDSDMILLVGRSYGATNVLVFDENGSQLASLIVNVVDKAPRLVTVNRGAAQNSYNCAPECRPVLRPGDADAFFKPLSEQSIAKQGLATSSESTSSSASGSN
jgi:Flp pilus assembly secretin CpaC